VGEREKEDEMAGTAKELMTEGCECVGESETVADAARKLAQLDVGAMPICGEDNKLKGMLTDRDIVVKVIAQGKDPGQTTAGDLGEGVPVTVSVDDSADHVMQVMSDNQIRRVPVLDNDKNLVGIISQADVATRASAEDTGEVVGEISKD
jgi:CBS domain-containing protein